MRSVLIRHHLTCVSVYQEEHVLCAVAVTTLQAALFVFVV